VGSLKRELYLWWYYSQFNAFRPYLGYSNHPSLEEHKVFCCLLLYNQLKSLLHRWFISISLVCRVTIRVIPSIDATRGHESILIDDFNDYWLFLQISTSFLTCFVLGRTLPSRLPRSNLSQDLFIASMLNYIGIHEKEGASSMIL